MIRFLFHWDIFKFQPLVLGSGVYDMLDNNKTAFSQSYLPEVETRAQLAQQEGEAVHFNARLVM